MPSALVLATVGATDANTYRIVAEADTYFGDRLNTELWTAATDDTKTISMLQAAKWMEQFTYEGYRRTYDQRLSWPRFHVYDRDDFWLDSDTVPEVVMDAQCELAYEILRADPFVDTGLERFNTAQIGSLNVDVRQERKAGAMNRIAERMLAPYLVGGGSSIVLIRA